MPNTVPSRDCFLEEREEHSGSSFLLIGWSYLSRYEEKCRVKIQLTMVALYTYINSTSSVRWTATLQQYFLTLSPRLTELILPELILTSEGSLQFDDLVRLAVDGRESSWPECTFFAAPLDTTLAQPLALQPGSRDTYAQMSWHRATRA